MNWHQKYLITRQEKRTQQTFQKEVKNRKFNTQFITSKCFFLELGKI
jgi:hypothetical protein